MKILAIDQASKISGWSVFENGELIEYGKVTFNDDDFILRVSKLRSWLNEFIDDNSIEKVILEDIQLQIDKESQQVVYGEGNIVNVQTFKKLAGLQAVLHELCVEKGIPVEIYHSSAWKSTCGIVGSHRQEQKRSAQLYIQNKYNVKVIQDIADAICLGEHACNPKEKAKVKTDSRTEYAPISWE
mgnify:CR=1 FL=1